MLQLSSMVGVPERDDRFEASYHHNHHHLAQRNMRSLDTSAHMDSGLVSNQYSTTSNQRRYGYTAYPNSHQASHSPPSPPIEEANKPSLPSISSLLGIADVKPGEQQQTQHLAQEQHQTGLVAQTSDYATDALSQNYGTVSVNGRISLPPTPPLVPDSTLEGNQSPSTVSTQSTVSAPQTYYLGQTMNAVEPQQRHGSYSEASVPKRLSITSQPTISPYPTPQYTPSNFMPSPNPISGGSYYTTDSHVLPSSGLYQQRALPTTFPPPMPLGLGGPPGHNSANPWQHHHYISTSSQSSFPQSQDRYVCPTCNKAFSRPSSLRIHSHSHTGEKPFKCSHVSCGKAFSVRSNMKRHERGCHAGNGSTMTSN